MYNSEENSRILNQTNTKKFLLSNQMYESGLDFKKEKRTKTIIDGSDSNKISKRLTNKKLNIDSLNKSDQLFLLTNELQRVEGIIRDNIIKKTILYRKGDSIKREFHSDVNVIPYKNFHEKSDKIKNQNKFKQSMPFSNILSKNTSNYEDGEDEFNKTRILKYKKMTNKDNILRSPYSLTRSIIHENDISMMSINNISGEKEKENFRVNESKNMISNILGTNIKTKHSGKQNNLSIFEQRLSGEVADEHYEHYKYERNKKIKETSINITSEKSNNSEKIFKSKTVSGNLKNNKRRRALSNENKKKDKYKRLNLKKSRTTIINKLTGVDGKIYKNDSDSELITETLISLNLDDYKLNKLREEIRNNMFINLEINDMKKGETKSFYKSSKEDEDDKGVKEVVLKEKKYRNITRKGLVYDSYSDEENDIMEDDNFVFHPESPFLLYFDLAIFSCCVYSALISPIYLAFFHNQPDNFSDGSYIFEIIIDILMMTDIFINFFVSYYDFEEKLITARKNIISNYLYSWFTLDVLSGIPFNSFILGNKIMNNIDTSSNFPLQNRSRYILSNKGYNLSDIFIIFRLFKLIKMFKSNRFIRFINYKYFEDLNIKATLERLLEFLLYFLIITHILGCIFIFLGWMATPNWIVKTDLLESSTVDIYIASVYFNWATIITIGYGDIHSHSTYERIYSVILLMIGVLVYSYAVSSLANFIQEKSEKEQLFEKNLKCLEIINIKYHLSTKLYKKIERFLKFNMTNNKIQETELLNSLPTALKNEMILRIFRPIIKNFIFFKHVANSSVDFTIKAILSMRPISAVKGEILVNEGEFIDEIIFVKMGALVLEVGVLVISNPYDQQSKTKKKELMTKTKEIKEELNHNYVTMKSLKMNMTPRSKFAHSHKSTIDGDKNMNQFEYYDKEYLKIIELRRNEHFGDILMFLNKRSPMSVRVKSKTVELFSMKKTDVVNISMNYPQIFQKIIKKSIFNHRQLEILIKRTKLLFYRQHKEHFENDNLNVPVKRKFIFTKPLDDEDIALSDIKLHNLALHSIPSEENTKRDNQEKSSDENHVNDDDVTYNTINPNKRINETENVKNAYVNFGKYTISEKNKSEEEEDDEESRKEENIKNPKNLSFHQSKISLSDYLFDRNSELKSNKTNKKKSYKQIHSHFSKKEVTKKSSKFKTSLLQFNDNEVNSEIENTEDKIEEIKFIEYKEILPHKKEESMKNVEDSGFKLSCEQEEILKREVISPLDSKNTKSFPVSDVKENVIYQPIMYNVNIKNNYNVGGKEEKVLSCSKCKSKIYPLSTNRVVVLISTEENPYQFRENLAWTNLEVSYGNSLEIKSESISNAVTKPSYTKDNYKSQNSLPLPMIKKSSLSSSKKENKLLENKSILDKKNPLYKRKSSMESFHKQKNTLMSFKKNKNLVEKIDSQDENECLRNDTGPRIINTDGEEKNFKRRKSRHMMTQIYKNIENNSLNLNDPQYFYSELLKSAMSKKKCAVIMKKMSERLDKLRSMIFSKSLKKG